MSNMLLENKDHVIQLRPQLNHVLEFLADFILSYDFHHFFTPAMNVRRSGLEEKEN